jgi:hypothetical protein
LPGLFFRHDSHRRAPPRELLLSIGLLAGLGSGVSRLVACGVAVLKETDAVGNRQPDDQGKAGHQEKPRQGSQPELLNAMWHH